MSEDDEAADSGVRVVGAPTAHDVAPVSEKDDSVAKATDKGGAGSPPKGRRAGPSRTQAPRRGLFIGTAALAVVGLAGTLVFALLWAGSSGSSQSDQAMKSAASAFLTELTNFNAKTIDADFSSITSSATGTFSSQATKFFNSSIRSELESALAESRGQIRNLYVQTNTGTSGSVYGVVDQTYVNNKISTPQSDVLRVVVNLQKVGSRWKISDVTVLEGATPASTGSASGSAGSSVPGQ